MTDVAQIARKANQLDPDRVAILSEFVDFLLTIDSGPEAEQAFPVTRIEDPEMPAVHQGMPLSLETVREAVDWETGEHR